MPKTWNTVRTDMSQIIKQSRVEKGLTRAVLAQQVGVSVGMIAHIENGIRGVSPKLARRFESVLGVSKEELRPDIYGPQAN